MYPQSKFARGLTCYASLTCRRQLLPRKQNIATSYPRPVQALRSYDRAPGHGRAGGPIRCAANERRAPLAVLRRRIVCGVRAGSICRCLQLRRPARPALQAVARQRPVQPCVHLHKDARSPPTQAPTQDDAAAAQAGISAGRQSAGRSGLPAGERLPLMEDSTCFSVTSMSDSR